MAFVDNLRRLRREQFLSQAELARRAGLHPLTITRLEAGRVAPSTRTIRALAEALSVELRQLATPDEVAELRRAFRQSAWPGGQVAERSNDSGHAGGATSAEARDPASQAAGRAHAPEKSPGARRKQATRPTAGE